MDGPVLILAFAVVALAWAIWVDGARRRARLLARIRAAWGQPRDRPRRMDSIAEYHRAIAPAFQPHELLDDRAWDDLNMDAVFAGLDRTESVPGQQALYHRLRRAPSAPDLEGFEALVSSFGASAAEREAAQLSLAHLQDPAGYDLWLITEPGFVDRRAWHVVFPIVGAVMATSIVAAIFWPGAMLITTIGAVMNLFVRGATAVRIASVVGPFRQVAPLISAAEGLRPLAEATSSPLLAAISRETRNLARLKGIARWVSRDPLATGELAGYLMELLNLLLLLDLNALYFGAGELERSGASLRRVFAAVGEADAALAVASWRAGERRWTRPSFREAGEAATLVDLRHPLVADAVPNTVELGRPRGLLVTGSNMSGKTTFVRTVGVNVVLAQSLHTCLAAGYQAPVLRLRSCIGRADDLPAGKSYYLVEVEAVMAMVRESASPAPCLFLFDELFRGTNAVERIAAAEAVLRELVRHESGRGPHLVLASTHDAELVDLLQDDYAACHFGDSLEPGGLAFDHRLRPGPAKTRNAIALLRLYGAPDRLVEQALARATALDRQREAAVGAGRGIEESRPE